ncbi:CRISPR-associated endonuclease Cas2 [Methanoculleus sp.]|uniref:CRISPR-associated endonuclease Cas2 n=1 Tax=Methanoculleus sp. TaxID=90427 RepID=UPI0034591EBF
MKVVFVLVTYDVNTETPEGRRRLRTVAKICTNYGTRVQNSVFECVVDSVQLMEMKVRIGDVIDPAIDSIRYYNLGKHGRDHVEHVGAKPGLNVEDVLIL